MRKVIITGATGTIGTALINELIKNDVEILVLIRKESQRVINIPINPLIKIHYCSLDELCLLTNDNHENYDVFFHLGWAGTSSIERDNGYIQLKNVDYTIDALECAKRFGCKKFIGIGSQAEYGVVDEILTTKTDTNPVTEYGKAKLLAGHKTKTKAVELGLEFNWIRVLSVYGPNDGDNTLISYLIKTMKKNEEVYVTKCEQIWDYLFCEDAATAIKAIAERGINNKTYVLGSGKGQLLKNYVETIKRILKSKSTINYGYYQYSKKQTMNLVADISDLINDVGWEPKYSFIEGINKMITLLDHNNTKDNS